METKQVGVNLTMEEILCPCHRDKIKQEEADAHKKFKRSRRCELSQKKTIEVLNRYVNSPPNAPSPYLLDVLRSLERSICQCQQYQFSGYFEDATVMTIAEESRGRGRGRGGGGAGSYGRGDSSMGDSVSNSFGRRCRWQVEMDRHQFPRKSTDQRAL
eukprot:Selendium_serpulae@DN6256_c0_g1_i6.p2